jgi:hypothetical protein
VQRAYSRDDFDRIRGQQRASTFTQLFFGEQAALALCAQLLNQVPEMETKLCLAGQVMHEARHVEVFGKYLDKLGHEAPLSPALEELVHPDPFLRDIIGNVLRDESRHAGFGVIHLADRFKSVSPAERRRVEDFVGMLWRLFHNMTGGPFGGPNEFLQSTFDDVAHRLQLIGLQLRN